MNKVLIACLILFLASCKVTMITENYCGRVIDKFKPQGNKVDKPHVVYFVSRLNRNVDVRVSWNLFANIKIGDSMCLPLRRIDLIK